MLKFCYKKSTRLSIQIGAKRAKTCVQYLYIPSELLPFGIPRLLVVGNAPFSDGRVLTTSTLFLFLSKILCQASGRRSPGRISLSPGEGLLQPTARLLVQPAAAAATATAAAAAMRQPVRKQSIFELLPSSPPPPAAAAAATPPAAAAAAAAAAVSHRLSAAAAAAFVHHRSGNGRQHQ